MLGTAFRGFGKILEVRKIENRFKGGKSLLWAIFILWCVVVAGLGFCRCVRVFLGLKLVLFFTPILVGFLGSVGFGGGF